MSMKKGLGRGMEALIPMELVDVEFDPTAELKEENGSLIELEIEKIIRDEDQPRKEFSQEALEELAASIKEYGILQPLVTVKEEDKYKIVAGERRWRAAKLLGLKKVPVIVRTLDAQNRLGLSIVENAQREDLSAIELATAYAKLKAQFNLDAKEIAKRVGKSESAIKNTMRLLMLPEEAKKIMMEKKLSEGVMRPLIKAPEELVMEAVEKIVAEDWSARQVERFVSERKKRSSVNIIKSNDFLGYESALKNKYRVEARVSKRKIVLSCKNEKELVRLLNALGIRVD